MDTQVVSIGELQGVEGGTDHFWAGWGSAVGGIIGAVVSAPLGGLPAVATIGAGVAAGAAAGNQVDHWLE
jgi:hypothetical protein